MPPFLLLYRFFDLNTAFNASILGHYILAFVACWLYIRRLGLPTMAAVFGALVYTYGWFPPRVSLEWAIVGGAWLPLALWCAESFLQTRLWRFALWLSVILALQMLAGHFLIAFLTQLTLALYIPCRLWGGRDSVPPESRQCRGRLAWALMGAVQLIPTWELKTTSQRATVTDEHNPGYGYIPPRYLTQLFLPWKWYASDREIVSVASPNMPRTNWVEAHLYFGLLPLPLIVWGVLDRRNAIPRAIRLLWLLLSIGAVVYATGCLIPITNHLPGFSFFEGPGRYGIIASLGAAVLAAAGFAAVCKKLDGLSMLVWWIVAFGATTWDLWDVSQRVTHATPVATSPVSRRDDSPIRKYLADRDIPTRMLNEGKNLPSLVGAGTYPVYLGLSPAAYYDTALALPQPMPFRETQPTAEQLDWLSRNGVTHVLSLTEVNLSGWPARQVWFGADPCLNVPLARNATHGFYLYELEATRGRVAWLEPANESRSELMRYEPTQVEIEVESASGGTVVMTDLAYPGWEVTVDGQPVAGIVVERVFRGVEVSDGKHRLVWTYVPRAIYWGGVVSGLALLALLTIGHVRYWHPNLLCRRAAPEGGLQTSHER
ncbi:MAG: YfhO family protein [Planctomycetota bacterium]|nr:YfhO family protein [Planctomycetota bacterium]